MTNRPVRIAVFICSFFLVQAVAAEERALRYADALKDWADILATHVDEQGRVNFAAVAASPAPLERYIDAVADYGPTSYPEDFLSREEVLVYHINTYNAQAMYGVIDRDIPDAFDSVFRRASFFRLRGVRIDGQDTNLHAYENKVIRPLGEPRLHFALNCMVRDCPRLPQRPFQALTLDQDLERLTREFFGHPRKLSLDHDRRSIQLSAILDFYTEDFVSSGDASELPAYVNRYLSEPLPEGYRVEFFDYDWTVNSQP